ncbi:hypothetical protein [Streptacidiphilus jiangxiensis]|uniref:Lipoprotein n=1 Tax=Streptacidiphilus jiangxiensis TaxID=235985 RepID=A0A1H7Y3Z7_STRJI|nr:hypothetical protein [Streptacidiphilus jiangxiensis]SEM40067.1 hypothetical protein SAMN05414137_12666 [Streptacidiphilus jiangxiensis]
MKQNKNLAWWAFRLAVPVAAAAATAGCALAGMGVEPLDRPVSTSLLVGHWTADSRCPHTTLDLATDLTGRVQRFPVDESADGLHVGRTVSGTVHWSQDPGLGSADIPATAVIELGTQGYALDYGRDEHGFVLVATVGDPDDGVACVYHRTGYAT